MADRPVEEIIRMSVKLKFWTGGIILAIAGLVLARVVSPIYASCAILQLAVFIGGVVVAMAGLAIILLGLRKS
jgi:hypothetical protein